MKSSIARVVVFAFSILAAALCVSASGAGLENEYVAVKFGDKGEIASIRNKATGRELVKKPIPFAVVTLKDGKTKLEPARFAQKGDRLGWSFPGGGGLMLSVKPYLISANRAIFLTVSFCDCFLSAPGAFYNPHAITPNRNHASIINPAISKASCASSLNAFQYLMPPTS